MQGGEANGEDGDGGEGFGEAEEVGEDGTEGGVAAHCGWGLGYGAEMEI